MYCVFSVLLHIKTSFGEQNIVSISIIDQSMITFDDFMAAIWNVA